jgi:ketosteroid isomerase-like protein
MFRAIVARRVRTAWRHVDARDPGFVLDQFAPGFEYSFAGDHALGGTRHTREAMEAWFQRLYGLFGDIRFEVQDVLVAGWPWRTRVVALVAVTATVDGEAYRNEVAQTIRLRWGRITAIHNLEDTQKLAGALERLGAAGAIEAREPAIVS